MRSKFTTIRFKPDISTINFDQFDKINELVIMPEIMETNSLTGIGNSGQLFSPLLAKSGNYRPLSVEKILDEGELEELPISKKRKLPGQRSQERRRARSLKKGKKLSGPPEKLVKGELPEVPLEIKMITAAPFFHVSK